MNEFELIEEIFKPLGCEAADVERGIGDDAAILKIPHGEQLVVSTDTQIESVHFPAQADPSRIAARSLACALSDLAAMGATSRWATLSLSVPTIDTSWLQAFARGVVEVLATTNTTLVGGDTTRGSGVVSWTVMGTVANGCALTRDGAALGDEIYVSGTLGGPAAAVNLFETASNALTATQREVLARFWGVQPRLELGQKLIGCASSCIDISDGLVADLGHIVRASGCGAELDLGTLPVTPCVREIFDASSALELAAFGGDDYELCFTAPRDQQGLITELSAALDVPLTRIGAITARDSIILLDEHRNAVAFDQGGYQHFD